MTTEADEATGAVITSDASVGAMSAHIARVAARLFAARGFDATSVREIVEAAGVTKPTLYYHFGSKEGLAQALLTKPLEGLASDLSGTLDATPDPVAALEAMVETNFAFIREDPDRARFLYALFFGPLGSSLVAEIAREACRLDSIWVNAAARLVEKNVIDANRAEACVTNLKGFIVVHTVAFLYRDGSLDCGLGRRLVQDLLTGIGKKTRVSKG